MARKTDLMVTICFLIYYCYYTAIGFVFGGMSRENYYPYLFFTLIGLMLIIASLFCKTISIYSITRIVGLLLTTTLLYFDIKGSFVHETTWDTIKTLLSYFPAIVFLTFSIFSLVRIFYYK